MKTRVLFLCTENSCRTQTAEVFLRELTGDELEVVGAGSEAGRLDSAAAVRHARDKIRQRVTEFVEKHYHGAVTKDWPSVSRTVAVSAAKTASKEPQEK